MSNGGIINEIILHIESGYPFLYLLSHEERRAVSIVASAAAGHGVPVLAWPFVKSGDSVCGSLTVSKNPETVINAISETKTECIFLLKDFNIHLRNPVLVRSLRDTIPLLEERRQMVVIISPVLEIPVELEKDIAILDLPLPGEAELAGLFKSVAGTGRLSISEEYISSAVRAARGLTFDEAHRVFKKTFSKENGFSLKSVDMIVDEKKRIIRRSEVLEYVETGSDLESIGGLAELKRWLKFREKAFFDEARKFGLPSPKGLLLCGIQGCGKSLTARVVARHWKIPLLRLDLGALFSYSFTPEEGLRRALKVAVALAPVVLWLDEIEKGFSSISSGGSIDSDAARSFGMLITWLQEKTEPVFVVATANEVQDLPPELLRKGRFDEVFFIDLPDVHEREEILKIHLRQRGRDPGNYDVVGLARDTEYFSGSELEQVIIAALYRAFGENREVSNEILTQSVNEVIPLYRTFENKIKSLREWASTRARQATKQSKVLDYFK